MNKNNQIMQYIKDYVNNDNLSASSIMIDGKWGTGKTYFVMHDLKDMLLSSKKKTVYISLNGISSGEELNQRIKYSFIKYNYKIKNMFQIIDGIDVQLLFEYFELGIIGRLFMELKKIVIYICKIFLNIFTNYRKRKTVFIFDDLERANIDADELFGIINNLVEHKKAKCIFIGNEQSIKEKDKFNIIKEKIISRTLYYDADIESFLNSIKDEVTKKMDNDKWEIFKRVAVNKDNQNLRTIMCTLPLIIKLCNILKPVIGDNQEISGEVLYKMFDDIYHVETWYKEGHDRLEYSEPDRYYMRISFDDNIEQNSDKKEDDFSDFLSKCSKEHLTFCYTFDLIYKGIFDNKKITNAYKQLYSEEKIRHDRKFLNILMDWYRYDDKDIEKAIYDLELALINNEIILELYHDVMVSLLRIIPVGLISQVKTDKIAELMKSNILRNPYYNFDFDCYSLNAYEGIAEELEKYMYEFNSMSKNKLIYALKEDLEKILVKDNWVKNLNDYYRNNGSDFKCVKKYYQLFDLDQLANAIYNLSNDLLTEYRVLEQKVKSDYALSIIGHDELASIKLLCDKLNTLNEYKEDNKIHYTLINYLIGDYKRYYKI